MADLVFGRLMSRGIPKTFTRFWRSMQYKALDEVAKEICKPLLYKFTSIFQNPSVALRNLRHSFQVPRDFVRRFPSFQIASALCFLPQGHISSKNSAMPPLIKLASTIDTSLHS